MRVTRTLHVAAPPGAVWTILDDAEKIKLWIPEVVETVHPDGLDRSNAVGTRFVQRIREGGRVKSYDGEVIAYEPERVLGVRLGDGSFSVDTTYRLSAEGKGTRLAFAAEAELKSWIARLMAPVGRLLLGSLVRKQLERLKALAEGAP